MNELNKLIDALVKEKGGTREQYLHLLNSIAKHETGDTLSPTQKQIGGGPGRGKYQFEVGRNKGGITAARRLKDYYTRNNNPIPKWLENSTKGESLDATTLTAEQQDALYLGNMREHPRADFAKLMSGKETVPDFWANYHWSGPRKQRKERIDNFKGTYTPLDLSKTQPFIQPTEVFKRQFSMEEERPIKEFAYGGGIDPPVKKSDTLTVNSKTDPRYIAYKDSLDIFNSNQSLVNNLKRKGYESRGATSDNKKWIEQQIKNYAAQADGTFKYDTPKSMVVAANPQKKGRLYEVDDLVPHIIRDGLGKQLFSKTVMPKGQKVYSENLLGLGFGDKRVTFDYSNVNPKQVVQVKTGASNKTNSNFTNSPTPYGNRLVDIPKGEKESDYEIKSYLNPVNGNNDWTYVKKNRPVERKLKTQSKGLQPLDSEISTELTPKRVNYPEFDYYNVKEEINPHFGGRTSEYRTENEQRVFDLIDQNRLDKNTKIGKDNRLTITPKYKKTKQFAEGGSIGQALYGGSFSSYGVGGRHETNPNGGIMLGPKSSVEQGETSFNFRDMGKYIFSNRITSSGVFKK